MLKNVNLEPIKIKIRKYFAQQIWNRKMKLLDSIIHMKYYLNERFSVNIYYLN
jgi:hypothetical protein